LPAVRYNDRHLRSRALALTGNIASSIVCAAVVPGCSFRANSATYAGKGGRANQASLPNCRPEPWPEYTPSFRFTRLTAATYRCGLRTLVPARIRNLKTSRGVPGIMVGLLDRWPLSFRRASLRHRIIVALENLGEMRRAASTWDILSKFGNAEGRVPTGYSSGDALRPVRDCWWKKSNRAAGIAEVGGQRRRQNC